MRVFVVVNRLSELGYRQTTALLAASILNLGHELFLVEVDGFAFLGTSKTSRYFLSGFRAVSSDFQDKADSKQIESFATSRSGELRQQFQLKPADTIMIRTNPGRDADRKQVHDAFLDFCISAKQLGVRIINDPERLNFFASKAALQTLPSDRRPEMLVTADYKRIAAFIAESGKDCVIKPLVGSRGENVIRLAHEETDLAERLRKQFGFQIIVAQHFVDSEEAGDKRAVVVDGQILTANGFPAGIHRIPATGDFRANLHAGGTATELKLTETQTEVVTEAALLLANNGIRLAGIDIIGEKIIEFNVFSTGGIFDANRFANADFSNLIVKKLLHE